MDTTSSNNNTSVEASSDIIPPPSNSKERSLLEELGSDKVETIAQGAEARIYKITFAGRPTIVKERFTKTYRHPTLDRKINNSRIQAESRMLARARQFGIDAPVVYHVDKANKRIYMEFIQGLSFKQYIYENYGKDMSEVATKVAQAIGNLHSNDIIHGDLTTSNILLKPDGCSVVMIDFGLSSMSGLPEDKAVDLYVLERAFLSTHPNSEPLFQSILAAYLSTSKSAPSVISRLTIVRQRGRKKLAFG